LPYLSSRATETLGTRAPAPERVGSTVNATFVGPPGMNAASALRVESPAGEVIVALLSEFANVDVIVPVAVPVRSVAVAGCTRVSAESVVAKTGVMPETGLPYWSFRTIVTL